MCCHEVVIFGRIFYICPGHKESRKTSHMVIVYVSQVLFFFVFDTNQDKNRIEDLYNYCLLCRVFDWRTAE